MLKQIVWKARSCSFVDASGGAEHAIFLSGSGRSGTTWIQEVICSASGMRPIFEPFDATRDPTIAPEFGKYLDPAASSDALRENVARVFEGRYRSAWSDRMHHPFRPIRYTSGRVVKDIRTLLWVGWILNEFPQMRYAHIIRNPYAVTKSAHELGWNANRLDLMLSQPGLVDEHLGSVTDAVRAIESPRAKLVAAWCIENRVAFATASHRGSLFVYEESKEDRASLVRGIRDLGIESPIGDTSRPSRMSRRSDSVSSHSPHAQREQTDEIRAVLGLFGFDHYYGPGGLTNSTELHRAWRHGQIGVAA